MTTLQYSRDELPIECHACGSVNLEEMTLQRDSYLELVECYCQNCRTIFRVEITED